jgi:4-carboxymuconolactone decarboxylase
MDETAGRQPGAGAASRYERGLAAREAVLGSEYVNAQLSSSGEHSEIYRRWQHYLTEEAWGGVWTRGVIDRKTRSLITITALATLGRSAELLLHLRGAIRNGWTPEELSEVLIHLSAYAGVPAAVEAFRVAENSVNTPSTNDPDRG